MITQVKIQNFKNHNCSQLKALSRINLLLGKNNSGKTSALESLFLLLSPHYLKTVFVLMHEQRGYHSENGSEDVFNSLFYNQNYQQAIYLEAIAHLAGEQKFKKTLQIGPILGEKAIKYFSNVFEMAKLESKMQGLQFHFQQSDLLNDKTIELKTNVSNLTPNQQLPTTSDDFILPKMVFIPSQGIPEAQQDAQRFSHLEINNQHSEVINLWFGHSKPRIRELGK